MIVYLFHDPRNHDPLYVGKGKEGRWKVHFKCSHNKHLKGLLEKFESSGLRVYVSVWNVVDNTAACNLERELIAKYGRRDLKTGILYNFTDGGDGPSGAKLTNEHKQKISSTLQKHSVTVETRSKISVARQGQTFSDATKKKISEAHKGLRYPNRANPLITCPHCKKTGKTTGMVRWHFDHCGSRNEAL